VPRPQSKLLPYTTLFRSAGSKKVEAYVDKVLDTPLLAENPVPSPVINKTTNTDFGFTELQFANGVRMILKPTDFKNDQILVSSLDRKSTRLNSSHVKSSY